MNPAEVQNGHTPFYSTWLEIGLLCIWLGYAGLTANAPLLPVVVGFRWGHVRLAPILSGSLSFAVLDAFVRFEAEHALWRRAPVSLAGK